MPPRVRAYSAIASVSWISPPAARHPSYESEEAYADARSAAINNAVQTEHGNVVCIERGSKLTYDIHYQIRLVEASSYDIDSYATLKGFVSGLYAGNYDITHIFIDSLCKIVPGPCDNETEKFLDWLNAFGEKHGIKFTITISDDASLAPEGIKKYF